MSSRLVYVVLVASSFLLMAASQSQLQKKDEVLSQWRIDNPDDEVMEKIADQFEVVAKVDQTYEIIVPESKKKKFLALVPDATMITSDLTGQIHGLTNIDPTWLDDYRRFDQIVAVMEQIVADYPEIASLEEYGQSARGQPLYALKLSDNVAVDEDEPEVMLTSATHGDELITVEVLVGLLEEWVAGYGVDERITNMIDGSEIYVLPVINPDGFTRQSRYANGTDPNRDYPWPEVPDRDSVPCIGDLIQFFQSRQFVGSLDFHAHGRMVMWPWAYTRDRVQSEDEAIFSELGQSMSEENGYIYGQISRVIYVAKGSSADFYYWKNGTIAYGIELADSKVPHPSRIGSIRDEAREMTLRFVEYFIGDQ